MASFGMRCCVVWLIGPSKTFGTYLPRYVVSMSKDHDLNAMRCLYVTCNCIFLLNLQKEKEEGKHEERRPFDRSVDLQTNRFDEAQKKAILKKAQLLNDRFASGHSKFL
jgi:hypothetical protein